MADGTFVVGQSSKVVVHAGKSNEMEVGGLNSMNPPIGFTTNYTTVSEFGVAIDKQIASGLTYDSVTCGGNFLLKSPSMNYLRQQAINAGKLTDLRWYFDTCSYVALDLISDPTGFIQVGSIPAPSGEKAGVYSGSIEFAPAGVCTLYENHRAGITLAFVADTGSGASVTDSANLFVINGFEAGQVCYADHVNSLDPLKLEIATVTAGTVTFVQNSGDEQSVPDFAGIATTKLSSGIAMKIDETATVCA